MTTLLISKDLYTLKEAREIAKNSNVHGKCRVIVINDIELYYCFGEIPTEDTHYNIDLTSRNKIFFISL